MGSSISACEFSESQDYSKTIFGDTEAQERSNVTKKDCNDETCATSRANPNNNGKETSQITNQWKNDGKTGHGSDF